MKYFIRRTLAVTLVLCFILAFSFSAGAVDAVGDVIASLDKGDFGDVVEYDYINKTERILSKDEIFDYASVTKTTYELDGMIEYLSEFSASESSMPNLPYSVVQPNHQFYLTMPYLNNTANHPYSGVMYLKMTYTDDVTGKSESYRGTGFMVAPDVMVTAGHNVDMVGKTLQEVKVYPYIHQESNYIPSNNYFIYPSKWICYDYSIAVGNSSLDEKDYDWCVMKLQNSLTDVYNFACSYQTSDITDVGDLLLVSGYPQCLNLSCPDQCSHRQCYQASTDGSVTTLSTYRVWYTNNTKPGNSGSPVYLATTKVCYAIHTRGRSTIEANSGVIINERIYNFIANYINS